MKKTIYFLSAILLGILVTTWYSCESDPSDPEESCAQDEICEGKTVSACCTEDACVWEYNGKEYTQDELDQLIADLGCAVAYSPEEFKAAKASIIDQLQALLEKAHAGLNQ